MTDMKITPISWDVAIEIAAWAQKESKALLRSANAAIDFTPANEREKAYLKWSKEKQIEQAEELRRFAREIVK